MKLKNDDLERFVQAGKLALERKDFVQALRLLLHCAEQGNAEAQANIGFLFFMGEGTKRDIPKAVAWLTKAAEQGRGEAAHNLGTLYLTCEPDMPRNPEASTKWYLKAKELGFVVAPQDWYDTRAIGSEPISKTR